MTSVLSFLASYNIHRQKMLIASLFSQFMHAGVLRDVEQQRLKKERQADFEMQRALEEEYRKVQSVNNNTPIEEEA